MAYCHSNKLIVLEMIDWAVNSDVFASPYHKDLALFSVEVLTGEMGEAHQLLIDSRSGDTKNCIENSSEIFEEIEAETVSNQNGEEHTSDKYAHLSHLLEYLSRDKNKLPPVCLNYLIRILSNLVSSNALDLYTYFAS
jgi:hypothetical protein